MKCQLYEGDMWHNTQDLHDLINQSNQKINKKQKKLTQ